MKFNKLLWILSLMLLLSVSFVSAVATAPNSTDVVGFYGFDTSVIGASDYSSNGNNGVLYGAPSFTSNGIYSGSYVFDGVDDYVSLGSLDNIVSVSLWVNVSSTPSTNSYIYGNGKDNDYLNGYFGIIQSSTTNYAMSYQFYDGSGWKRRDTGVYNGVHHLVFVVNSSESKSYFYIDGVLDTTINYVPSGFGTAQESRLGVNNIDTLTSMFGGIIDEVSLFDVALNGDNVEYLYNSGSPTSSQQYPFNSYNNFSVTAKDSWNDSSINSFWVYINGTNYTTTNGTINTNLYQNDTSNYTLQVGATDYFSKTYEDVNIRNNLAATIYQSQINFSVAEYITNNTITSGNCTVETTNQLCNLPFYLSAGDYNVTFNSENYINKTVEFNVTALDNKTIPINDVFGLLINVTPKNILTSSSLSNFTGWLYDVNNDVNMSFRTTRNYYVLPGIINGSYLLSVSPDGYATTNTSFIANNTYYNVSTYHYLYNSFYVTFKDEVTNNIVSNVTLDLISNLYSNNYSTTNGTMYISTLTPEGYTLRYTSDNYTTRFYYLDVVDDSAFNITLYLKEDGTALDTTVIIYDTGSSSNLEEAMVKVQRYDLSTNSYKVVQMGKTDSDGEIIFDIVQDSEFYKFIVEYDDEIVKVTEPQSIDKTIIKIPVTIGNTYLQTYSIYNNIVYSLEYNTLSNNFRFLFNDPSGISRTYCLYLYSNDYDSYTLVNSSCITSSSGTILLPVIPVNGTTFTLESYVTISSDNIFLTKDSVSFKNDSFGDNGLFLQLLLTLLFVSSGFIFVEAIPIAVPLSLIVGGLFYFHSIPLYFTFPLLVLGVIVSFWVGKNG